MNTNKLISSVFVVSFAALAACTPQDKRISDDIRPKIKGFQNNGGRQTAGELEFALGNYSLSGFLAERQIEAIELVKIASGSLDANRTRFTKTVNDAVLENGARGVSVNAIKDEMIYTNRNAEWKTRMDSSWTGTFLKDQTLQSLELSGKHFIKTDATKVNRVYVNLTDKVYTLSVSAGPQAGTLAIKVNTNGTLAGPVKGKNTVMNTEMELNLVVDAASLETDSVNVISSYAKINYPAQKPNDKNPIWSLVLKGEAAKVSLESLCNSVEGQYAVESGPAKLTLFMSKDDMKVSDPKNGNAVVELPACGERPTVVAARLFLKDNIRASKK